MSFLETAGSDASASNRTASFSSSFIFDSDSQASGYVSSSLHFSQMDYYQLLEKAKSFGESNDMEAAIKLYQKAIKLGETDLQKLEARFLLSCCLVLINLLDQALKECKLIIFHLPPKGGKPMRVKTRLLLAEIYELKGDFSAALKNLTDILRVDAENFLASIGIGHLYLRMEEPEKALQVLSRILKAAQTATEKADAYCLRSMAFLTVGDLTNALAAARHAQREAPKKEAALRMLVHTLIALSDRAGGSSLTLVARPTLLPPVASDAPPSVHTVDAEKYLKEAEHVLEEFLYDTPAQDNPFRGRFLVFHAAIASRRRMWEEMCANLEAAREFFQTNRMVAVKDAKGEALDPLLPGSFGAVERFDLATALFITGRFEEALEVAAEIDNAALLETCPVRLREYQTLLGACALIGSCSGVLLSASARAREWKALAPWDRRRGAKGEGEDLSLAVETTGAALPPLPARDVRGILNDVKKSLKFSTLGSTIQNLAATAIQPDGRGAASAPMETPLSAARAAREFLLRRKTEETESPWISVVRVCEAYYLSSPTAAPLIAAQKYRRILSEPHPSVFSRLISRHWTIRFNERIIACVNALLRNSLEEAGGAVSRAWELGLRAVASEVAEDALLSEDLVSDDFFLSKSELACGADTALKEKYSDITNSSCALLAFVLAKKRSWSNALATLETALSSFPSEGAPDARALKLQFLKALLLAMNGQMEEAKKLLASVSVDSRALLRASHAATSGHLDAENLNTFWRDAVVAHGICEAALTNSRAALFIISDALGDQISSFLLENPVEPSQDIKAPNQVQRPPRSLSRLEEIIPSQAASSECDRTLTFDPEISEDWEESADWCHKAEPPVDPGARSPHLSIAARIAAFGNDLETAADFFLRAVASLCVLKKHQAPRFSPIMTSPVKLEAFFARRLTPAMFPSDGSAAHHRLCIHLHELGVCYWWRGQHRLAQKAFALAVREKKGFITAAQNLARLHAGLGELEQAAAITKKLSTIYPAAKHLALDSQVFSIVADIFTGETVAELFPKRPTDLSNPESYNPSVAWRRTAHAAPAALGFSRASQEVPTQAYKRLLGTLKSAFSIKTRDPDEVSPLFLAPSFCVTYQDRPPVLEGLSSSTEAKRRPSTHLGLPEPMWADPRCLQRHALASHGIFFSPTRTTLSAFTALPSFTRAAAPNAPEIPLSFPDWDDAACAVHLSFLLTTAGTLALLSAADPSEAMRFFDAAVDFFERSAILTAQSWGGQESTFAMDSGSGSAQPQGAVIPDSLCLNKAVCHLLLEQHTEALELIECTSLVREELQILRYLDTSATVGPVVDAPLALSFASCLLLRGLLSVHLGREAEASELFKMTFRVLPEIGNLFVHDELRLLQIYPPTLPAKLDFPICVTIAERAIFIPLTAPEFFAYPPPFFQAERCLDPSTQLPPNFIETQLIPPSLTLEAWFEPPHIDADSGLARPRPRVPPRPQRPSRPARPEHGVFSKTARFSEAVIEEAQRTRQASDRP
eukprot:gnl/Chilomastix_cuspidata/3378.p1 GENE.gnl/Chilomastix_cuspidata/3378~~gnl/Chilomastix_cuspidata/3378.p1  ORF type:complete len:1508 (+),score=447.30 gnl/Chilomastix_cuspidata/3378:32-4555(+)